MTRRTLGGAATLALMAAVPGCADPIQSKIDRANERLVALDHLDQADLREVRRDKLILERMEGEARELTGDVPHAKARRAELARMRELVRRGMARLSAHNEERRELAVRIRELEGERRERDSRGGIL